MPVEDDTDVLGKPVPIEPVEEIPLVDAVEETQGHD
jgi:hypothetical protein